jgi:hypothetical protein
MMIDVLDSTFIAARRNQENRGKEITDGDAEIGGE